MKPIITAVITACILTISANVFAQQKSETSRYYVGMGAQLYTVEENILMLSGNDGKKYSNKNGQLTGLTFLRQILKGGPADKAGLKDMDILLEVDRLIVTSMPGGFAIAHLTSRSEGDSVNLKVRRIDVDGITLNEFNVDVVLERIDRVAWVPLDLPLGGSFCTGDSCISYGSEISENKTTGKFTYRYSFSSTYSKPVILQSTVLNFLLRTGEADTAKYLMKISPMKTSSFLLETDVFPVTGAPSATREFIRAVDEPEMLKYFKENYPDVESPEHYYKDSSGELWLYTGGTTWYLFVPANWYEVMWQENEQFWKR